MTTAAGWKARPGGTEYGAMRARLVDAAEQIVRDGGVGALRLDSVADAVGLHRSSLYRYFNSKVDLITAVVVQTTLRLGREVLAQLGEDAPPERFLVEGLSIALARMAQDPVHRSLMAPSASESMSRIASNVVTEGIRPLIEPMFAAASRRGVLRAGLTPDDAMRWLQVIASGLVHSPDIVSDPAELTRMLELMLVPALLDTRTGDGGVQLANPPGKPAREPARQPARQPAASSPDAVTT